MMEEVKRKCCPKCGGTIVVSYLYQTSHDCAVTKQGRLSKRFTRTSEMPLDESIAGCRDCNADWGVGDFWIDQDGCFWDYKYTEDEE